MGVPGWDACGLWRQVYLQGCIKHRARVLRQRRIGRKKGLLLWGTGCFLCLRRSVRFVGAARGGAEPVSGRASLLAVPPKAGLPLRCSRQGGAAELATRPLAAALRQLRPVSQRSALRAPTSPLRCSAPTRRPARDRLSPWYPALHRRMVCSGASAAGFGTPPVWLGVQAFLPCAQSSEPYAPSPGCRRVRLSGRRFLPKAWRTILRTARAEFQSRRTELWARPSELQHLAARAFHIACRVRNSAHRAKGSAPQPQNPACRHRRQSGQAKSWTRHPPHATSLSARHQRGAKRDVGAAGGAPLGAQ